jgi:hypothetical protein
METYYNFPVPIRLPMFAALDLRYINNPGYGQRPRPRPGRRLHLELREDTNMSFVRSNGALNLPGGPHGA